MEILSILIPIGLIIAFTYTYIVGKIPTNTEKQLQPLFNIQCGGSFGWTNMCSPLVRLTLYDEFLVISYGNIKHTLNYEHITSVTKVPHLFSQSLKYKHNDEHLPKKITIWSKSTNEVQEILKSHNVNVKNV